jgi:hypothetical protein
MEQHGRLKINNNKKKPIKTKQNSPKLMLSLPTASPE